MKVKLLREVKLLIVGVPVGVGLTWLGTVALETATSSGSLGWTILCAWLGAIAWACGVGLMAGAPIAAGVLLWKRYDVQVVQRFKKWMQSDGI